MPWRAACKMQVCACLLTSWKTLPSYDERFILLPGIASIDFMSALLDQISADRLAWLILFFYTFHAWFRPDKRGQKFSWKVFFWFWTIVTRYQFSYHGKLRHIVLSTFSKSTFWQGLTLVHVGLYAFHSFILVSNAHEIKIHRENKNWTAPCSVFGKPLFVYLNQIFTYAWPPAKTTKRDA